MPVCFSYAPARLASVQAAASRLRQKYPLISVTVTERGLELSNLPANVYLQILQAAAAELIGAGDSRCLSHPPDVPETVAQAA